LRNWVAAKGDIRASYSHKVAGTFVHSMAAAFRFLAILAFRRTDE
jgi:hypothetical protein